MTGKEENVTTNAIAGENRDGSEAGDHPSWEHVPQHEVCSAAVVSVFRSDEIPHALPANLEALRCEDVHLITSGLGDDPSRIRTSQERAGWIQALIRCLGTSSIKERPHDSGSSTLMRI